MKRAFLALTFVICLPLAALAQGYPQNPQQKKVIDSLQNLLTETQKKVRTLETEKRHMQEDIDNLREDVKDLQVAKKKWVDYLGTTIGDKWKGKSFTEVNLEALQKDMEECRLYAKDDKRIQTALQQMGQLSDAARLYALSNEALNSPYDKKNIDSLLELLEDLVRQAPDAAARQKVEHVRNLLKEYRPTIRIFQGLIKSVDAEVASWSGKAALTMANRLINKEEDENGTVSAINDIPWLGQQYDAYYKALQKDPKGKNPARDRIMGIAL